MTNEETIVFGVPVPSDDPVFISIVVVHIVIGIICVIAGVVAMLSRKERERMLALEKFITGPCS